MNWGSLDQQLLTSQMDLNARRAQPWTAAEVMYETIVLSAVRSAEAAETYGLGHDRIVLSAKVSNVQDLIAVYRTLAKRSDYPLHLGLTEAGMGNKGVIASTAAMAVLMQEGIGDTIRVSLTPQPDGDRCEEVEVAKQLLQSLEIRHFHATSDRVPGLRAHHEHLLPRDGQRDPSVPTRSNAELEGPLCRCRNHERSCHGVRSERTRRVQARRHRNLTTWQFRGTCSPGLYGRKSPQDPAGRPHRRGVHRYLECLRGEPVRIQTGHRHGAIGPHNLSLIVPPSRPAVGLCQGSLRPNHGN